MRKSLTAFAAAGTLGLATIAAPTTADARWGWWGPALGGLAVGAIIGSALTRPAYGYPAYSDYGYAPAYSGYAYSPGYSSYYAPRPYYGCSRWRGGYRYRVC
jgi:hypothetical protein